MDNAGKNMEKRARYLEPLVIVAIQAKKAEPEQPPEPISGPFTFENYKRGVQQDIDKMASVKATSFVIQYLSKHGPEGYTDADLDEAIQAADDLLTWGLLLESRHGDCDTAINELAEKVPGFSRNLYSDIIGYFGYINR